MTAERLAGYEDALSAAGLRLDAVPIYEVHLNARTLGARRRRRCSRSSRPTAVLGMSDEIALGVIDGARAAGLDVPDDLSVVGFDDVAARARRAG